MISLMPIYPLSILETPPVKQHLFKATTGDQNTDFQT